MAEGRALTNLNHSLQDSSTSIEDFEKRLTIAKESNDQIGQRHAHVNLGHGYLCSEDLNKALYHYSEAMTIGETLKDGLFQAQMSFIIGRVYFLKQENDTAIYFHEKHLNFARQFHDAKGQCRAYLLLSELYQKSNQPEKGRKYFNLYEALAREIDGCKEEKSESTKDNFRRNLRTESISISLSESHLSNTGRSHSVVASNIRSPIEDKLVPNLMKKTKLNFIQHLTKKSPLVTRKQTLATDPDELMDLVCRMQKSRFDDQRCDIPITNHSHLDKKSLQNPRPSSQLDDILNTVDRLQQNRLDDQRTNFPRNNQRLSPLNEQFFDQLARSQESRMNDQRACLLPLPQIRPLSASQTKTSLIDSTSTTLPDGDFFSLLNRVQSRLNRHDTCLSTFPHSPSKQTRLKS